MKHMKFEVYLCGDCDKPFCVIVGADPKCCPYCESKSKHFVYDGMVSRGKG